MSKPKHAKGPWLARSHGHKFKTFIYEASTCMKKSKREPNLIAVVEHEANAELIASAPELIEKLMGVAYLFSVFADEGCNWTAERYKNESDELMRVIKKARGEK